MNGGLAFNVNDSFVLNDDMAIQPIQKNDNEGVRSFQDSVSRGS